MSELKRAAPVYEEELTRKLHIDDVTVYEGQWVKSHRSDVIGPIIGAELEDRDHYYSYFLMIPCVPGYQGGGPMSEWRVNPRDVRIPLRRDFYREFRSRPKIMDDFYLGDRCLHIMAEEIVTIVDPSIHGRDNASDRIMIQTPHGIIVSTYTSHLINITLTGGIENSTLLYGDPIDLVTDTGQRLFWQD